MPLDDFNRANSNGLGANWTLRNHANNPGVSSNSAALVDGTGAGFCPATYNTPALSDSHFAEVKYLFASRDPASGPIVRASAGGTAVLAMAQASSPALQIATITSWAGGGFTSRATTTTTFAINDVIRLGASGNVYTVYKNGVSVLTWTDSGGVVPIGSTQRLTGLFIQFSAGPVASSSLDDFNIGVLTPYTRTFNQSTHRASLH